MKKFFAIAVIAIAFVACNNDAEKKPAEDTTVVVAPVDTTAPVAPVAPAGPTGILIFVQSMHPHPIS